MSRQPLFDQEPLRQLRELDQDSSAGLVAALIDMFDNSINASMQELESAVKEMDAKRAGSIAHTLKSSSGNLGAAAFSQICGELEELTLRRDFRFQQLGPELLSELLEILPETLETLRRERSSRAS